MLITGLSYYIYQGLELNRKEPILESEQLKFMGTGTTHFPLCLYWKCVIYIFDFLRCDWTKYLTNHKSSFIIINFFSCYASGGVAGFGSLLPLVRDCCFHRPGTIVTFSPWLFSSSTQNHHCLQSTAIVVAGPRPSFVWNHLQVGKPPR